MGLPPPAAILRVSPPTSGSILSTAALQRLEYVFRAEEDGQRGQEIQARGSLCWLMQFNFYFPGSFPWQQGKAHSNQGQ